MISSLLCFLASVAVANAIVCTPELCALSGPSLPLHCKGSVIPNGGFCGCSDACAKVEGESCQTSVHFLLGIPTTDCDKGLTCQASANSVLGTGVCVSTSHKRNVVSCQQARMRSLISMVVYKGQWTPVCDAVGNYVPKQCNNIGECFCVDTHTGDKLQGTNGDHC